MSSICLFTICRAQFIWTTFPHCLFDRILYKILKNLLYAYTTTCHHDCMHSYMTYTVKLITFLKLIKPSKTVEVFRFKTEKKSNTVMCIKKTVVGTSYLPMVILDTNMFKMWKSKCVINHYHIR